MSEKILRAVNKGLTGELTVPGDKSISHRSIILGALANGTTTIENFLDGEDCIRTIDAFRLMGVSIDQEGKKVTIKSQGKDGLKEPLQPINLGNSGTTARLLIGLLSGLNMHTTLFGDASLTNRPMDRITDPLKEMGASIDGRQNGKYLPIAIRGQRLNNVVFEPKVKSAQVKSGVLLAGLTANGQTTVIESTKTRDHTENMLKAFGGKINVNGNEIVVDPIDSLKPTSIQVPGDISSAAFFLVAASIVPGSKLTIKDVGLNPTRTGIIDSLKKMDASISVEKTKEIGGEIVGDVTVKYSNLKGATIEGDIIPSMIDEIPILALMATQAKGKTIIKDAEELRYKETDRIMTVVDTLKALGAHVEATQDGMIIEGPTPLKEAKVSSHGDHRIGMMIAVASLIATGHVTLKDSDAINISYPGFFDHLDQLTQ
ncbi:3-phosphoshikimate 1-carboxyvinyltransferase [Pelagirhabdus alkalitolerans]|uniref:3-phosphoshikimate 1-carboxyvinyltransferase n=1 Tax=Pelagirhabdus alkalitolerans TaxID=1612202 RepID=A0A1G6HCT2_9BACI|nr:3-phosphoshikimate 1-carboxyvinyltransferase [Pelagirhabdus alkalitolerans]SDB91246.1 3-phosphoshikimate 1-carboxyvinyltransferase [Pelagirhabdus alkalitolerans]